MLHQKRKSYRGYKVCLNLAKNILKNSIRLKKKKLSRQQSMPK